MAAPARLWRIRRIHLDRVGSPAARFRDVWLDLTGRDGRPLDTILWMRNGGGKSTLIALVCALVRPDRRDFLATATTGRHLEDCVLGADTGHVVVEWTDPDGRRLVTGAVYEWTDRAQPADPNAAHDRLKQSWYAFTPAAGVEIEQLPFAGLGGLPTDLRDFVRAVETLPPETDAVVTAKQDRWAQALQDRGLDPGLFTAILKINATEGGIEHHFKFKTSDDFVQYLLSLVTEPTSATKVATILRGTRERLARQPRLRAEVTFCDEATGLLADLGKARSSLGAAEELAAAERAAAARLAGAFALAATVADEAAEAARAGGASSLTQAERAASTARALDARVRDLRFQAARQHLAAAVLHVRASATVVHERHRSHRAWQLVPLLTERDALAGRLAALRHQQQEAEEGAAPLRRARSAAAAVYVAALRAACAGLDTAVATAGAAADAAATEQAAARAQADALRSELGGLDARAGTVARALSAFDSDLAAAVAAGHLPPDGELDAALAAGRDEDREADERLTGELPAAAARLAEDRAAHERERSAVQSSITELTHRRATLDAERTPLLAEIEALATDPRLTALTERDRVDPVAEQRLLAEQLAEAIIAADRQRIQLAVADAEDDRAVQALGSARGLLPASLDLARAADVLAAERIPATTGWHLLADAVPPDRWALAVTAAPHLVGGLLVHDPADLDRARAVLEAAQLYPTSAVQVAPAAALHAAVDAPAPAAGGFVLPPAPALYDRTAAAREADRRAAGRAGRGVRVQELLDARDHDLRLRDQLRLLAERCPPGHREHLDAEHARLTELLARANARAAELDGERADLDERAAAHAGQLRALAERRRILATRLGVLTDLARRSAEAFSLRTERDGLPAERSSCEQRLALAEDRERSAAAVVAASRADADRHRATLRGYLARVEELHRLADGPVPAPLPGLAAAQSAYEAADEAYARQSSGSAIEATANEITRRLEGLDRQVNQFTADEHTAAAALAATVDAADAEAVRHSTERAEESHFAARADATRAETEAEAARQSLAAHEAARPTPAELEAAPGEPADEPRDAAEATAWAEAHRERLDAALREEQEARERAAAAERAAEAGRRLAADLRELAADLRADLADEVSTVDSIAPFAGDADEAREAARQARRSLQGAERAGSAARSQLHGEVHRMDRWAGEERFAAVTAEVRDRFRSEQSAALSVAEAERLAGELATYRHALAGELAAVDKDKHLVVTALCAEVREGLKTLQRAQHHAQLPAGLADHLRNRRFLDVGPRSNVDTTDATLRSRVERLVDRLVAKQDPIPDGLALVWEATAAVVGRGNFVARVLKPSTELGEDRQPVELMSKWSGGEKVTISLLLFCMLARLRAANRGGDVPGLGVLPMDNPLGTANYVAFLDLQRRVAAANGIQLVFLSGLGDMRAVGRFPNVVRMRNTHHRGRNYAQVMARDLNDDQVLEGITTARLTFPVQETLL
ncbi:hypothetical protein ACFFX1_00780 [Dactylosporangium sucinum]|uniref:Uncharacterized protein n=1 Tax=Dactylosporangium sucinum TaxID=1424081 RepID=A0A917WQT0_9ACTN|nr:hypothetical protein [Dactylosporangium sucinum]GGM21740.1 hypothetical protein GCM10007977_023640 [Dactylosporangium sucinum]